RAVKTYDSSFGTSFRTYASLCVDRSIITAVNKTLAKHIVPKSAVVPLDDVGDFKSAALPSAEHEVMYKLDMDELMGGLTDTLSEFEIRVFRLLLCGISYKAISEKLGCSEKSVDNAIQRIRRKLS
ncbi:MAG: sigma factor-like helix-turn-helix DNA-binding protein, partial [Acutalibacteraceae bacterium]